MRERVAEHPAGTVQIDDHRQRPRRPAWLDDPDGHLARRAALDVHPLLVDLRLRDLAGLHLVDCLAALGDRDLEQERRVGGRLGERLRRRLEHRRLDSGCGHLRLLPSSLNLAALPTLNATDAVNLPVEINSGGDGSVSHRSVSCRIVALPRPVDVGRSSERSRRNADFAAQGRDAGRKRLTVHSRSGGRPTSNRETRSRPERGGDRPARPGAAASGRCSSRASRRCPRRSRGSVRCPCSTGPPP